jgi:hypothetical protein
MWIIFKAKSWHRKPKQVLLQNLCHFSLYVILASRGPCLLPLSLPCHLSHLSQLTPHTRPRQHKRKDPGVHDIDSFSRRSPEIVQPNLRHQTLSTQTSTHEPTSWLFFSARTHACTQLRPSERATLSQSPHRAPQRKPTEPSMPARASTPGPSPC